MFAVFDLRSAILARARCTVSLFGGAHGRLRLGTNCAGKRTRLRYRIVPAHDL